MMMCYWLIGEKFHSPKLSDGIREINKLKAAHKKVIVTFLIIKSLLIQILISFTAIYCSFIFATVVV